MVHVLRSLIIGLFCLLVLSNIGLSQTNRPALHFTPPSGWMNDPNGLLKVGEEYHLFYQHFPKGLTWGPMHWGHAVSTNLINWQHRPIALYPDSLGMIFSGSAVYDTLNTSGLGTNAKPPIVLIYTYDNGNGTETQALAFSNDRGQSWVKYSGNPVVTDSSIRDFRDPKVFWHAQTKQWVMVLSAGNSIRFFTSPNLINWTRQGSFSSGDLSLGVYECPDLFEISIDGDKAKKWVLLVSFNNGTISGKGGTAWFSGSFDGKNFKADNPLPSWFDFGADNYAGVTYNLPYGDQRRIMVGWMNNWSYAERTPENGWRCNMTMPRCIKLRQSGSKLQLLSLPVKEIEHQFLESGRCSFKELEIKTLNIGEKAYKIDFEIKQLTDSFAIVLSNSISEELVLQLEARNGRLTMDRSRCGNTDFSDFFRLPQQMPLPITPFTLSLYYDVNTVEVFVNQGEASMAQMVFPSEILDRISLKGVSETDHNNTVQICTLIRE